MSLLATNGGIESNVDGMDLSPLFDDPSQTLPGKTAAYSQYPAVQAYVIFGTAWSVGAPGWLELARRPARCTGRIEAGKRCHTHPGMDIGFVCRAFSALDLSVWMLLLASRKILIHHLQHDMNLRGASHITFMTRSAPQLHRVAPWDGQTARQSGLPSLTLIRQ